MMQYPVPEINSPWQPILDTLMAATAEIAILFRNSPIIKLETRNKFGDTQLQQDIHSDEILEAHLRKNPMVKGFCSEERPDYQVIGEGDGYAVTYDPLDGSSIVDNNFSVGSIYSIWPTSENQLIGEKLGSQKTAAIAIYGPRTTFIFYNSHLDRVQELTLIEGKWILSHDHLTIQPTTKIYSPGNTRGASESEEYTAKMLEWIKKGYTLRYSGGLAPDVVQILIKGNGIFLNIGTKTHKEKLRVLYEAAAVGFLIVKAGGMAITRGNLPLLDYRVKTHDDRISFAVGSQEEVQGLKKVFEN